MAAGVGVAAGAAVGLVVAVVVLVAVFDEGLLFLDASAEGARVLGQVCGAGLVAQGLGAQLEGQAAEEAKVRGRGDEGGVLGLGLHVAFAASTVEARVAGARVAHRVLAAGLLGGAVGRRGAEEALEVVVAPAQQAVALVVLPVVVEVEAELCAAARAGSVAPPVIRRREARRGQGVAAMRRRGQARVDVALREAVDVLGGRLVGVLEVLRDVLDGAVPAGVAAAVHGDGGASCR